ncbi:aftiphilin a isoform X4 [Danio rerio]|uniref:Aftiphilin a isoform X4 n=3 Tax=Danio rerio TaxID=7955 RepID=A0AC58J354_DANRE|nr:aftiphilin isoform X4 [Danio rerio]|eukprot:XP_005160231.1 aftiphilin isoform X4 [Danio rerio]
MEPDVIRIYSSSPPPMEDAGEDEEDEFSDFTGVPNSTSFSEFDTPTTFNQSQALNATSPPELLSNGRIVGLSSQSAGSTKANGVAPGGGQTGMPNGRTVSVEELKKLTEHQAHITSLEFPTSSRTDNDCNGTVEVLTNGFASLEQASTPHKNNESDDDFADFSAFSNADHDQPSNTDWELSNQGCRVAQNDVSDSVELSNQGSRLAQNDVSGECEDSIEAVSKITGFELPSESSEGLSNGDLGFHEGSDLDQRDLETNTTEYVSTSLTLNGVARSESDDNSVSPNGERCSGGQSDEKGSETEETETETSFGRPLSTEALEEFGDFSTTGSVPSPPLQEETATPADHSQLVEDDDEDFGDFGDFGDANAFSAGGFADFDQQGAETQVTQPEAAAEKTEDDEFGDFDTSKEFSKTDLPAEEATTSADFPGSDSFADFSSAQGNDGADDGGWQAFSEPDQSQNGEESWATFEQAQDGACAQMSGDKWQPDTAPPTGVEERKSCTTAALVSRLEKIFQVSFELVVSPQVEDEVNTLHSFLKPPSEEQDRDRGQTSGAVRDVWQQLQDVNNAFGLRYQWGGSHTNKALLCSLGIDTRNILFTGHKKQPVIVPMYAASLGMLEPTKEPVKPVSAAEMIASIAQSPSVATELSSCPPDSTQESLPPVQFDWSSSGLTNPLDGVDPELYELTQVKLEVSGGSSRVVDAFARLMSTVEKTSTSTRKPVPKEENLSPEAQRVISGLPDLSFMQAKVLMFPSTLTPLLPSSSTPD